MPLSNANDPVAASPDDTAGESAARRHLSRRAVVAGAAGAGVAAAIPVGLWAFRRGTDQQEVPSLVGSDVLRGIALNAHPTFQSTVYGEVEEWLGRLASTGVRTFRGGYVPSSATTARTVAACRSLGITWIMLVVPEGRSVPTDQSPAETKRTVEQIADTCPDVCAAIEGINEPNHNRSGVPIVRNWASAYVAPHQQAIWEAVQASSSLAHVEVIGPSLNDPAAMTSYRSPDAPGGPRHFDQLVDVGVGAWIHRAGLHFYPRGYPPLVGLEDRLDLLHGAFGPDVKAYLTEFGYNNALHEPTDAAGPVSPEAAATYLPRAVLQYAAMGLPCAWYELLDDPDPGGTQVQANFGLWKVRGPDTNTWTPKPGVSALKALVASLGGPENRGGVVSDASAGPVPSTVTVAQPAGGDVTCVVTTRPGGLRTAHLFRDVSVWDPIDRQTIEVDEVAVTVSDGHQQQRRVSVGADITTVPI